MPNDLFRQMNRQPQNDGGFGGLLAQFQQFRAQYQGDPKADIQKLLQSGKITQAQLDQVQQMAGQFMNLLPHK